MHSPLHTHTLPVVVIYTANRTATRIRLAAPGGEHIDMSLFDIASFIPADVRHVYIKGDEPLAYDEPLGLLISALTFDKKIIHIETSAIIDPPDFWKNNGSICWTFQPTA